jgi:hypothetical protein
MNKDACCLGGNIQKYFGIASQRTKKYYHDANLTFNNPDCWIMDIPEKYKPDNYMKIENGCYW